MYKYIYVSECACVCVCIYKYICIHKFGPGVDSGSRPLGANKKKNLSTAHLLITKPHAQSPIHELPYKKRYYSFFEEK